MLKTVRGRMGRSRGWSGSPQSPKPRELESTRAQKQPGKPQEAPWAEEKEEGVGRGRI